jgi:predicted ATPase
MADILIKSLYVKNVRLFSELNIRFNAKFNFLAGPNGCGKTSVLACIAHCFSNRFFEYSRYGKDAEFWADIDANGEAYRIGLGAGTFNGNEYRNPAIKQWVQPPLDDQLRKSLPSYQAIEQLQASPLFIGTRRNIGYQQIAGIQREKQTGEALNEYISNNIRSLYGEWQPNIKQWIINRDFMIEKDWAAQEKQNWEHFTRHLPKIAPFNSNFSYIKTGRDLEPVFSVYSKECYLEELSAGFQAVLSLIIDIFSWIESTMEGDSRLAVNTKGTVLIDEPDIHLHPEWQLTLREGLAALFPNMQFILTTHSPHLLASAGHGEVIVMPKSYIEPVYNLAPREKAFSGWQTEDILREIMGVESLDHQARSILIEEAYAHIDGGNIPGLKHTIDALKQICHPNDTIVTELTIELASLQLRGKEDVHD